MSIGRGDGTNLFDARGSAQRVRPKFDTIGDG